MKIGIDFDRVLFDTDSFNKYLRENVEGLHHVETPPRDENGCYDPEKHAKLCGLDKDAVYQVLDERLEEFLYEDIEKLEQLSDDVEKIIVTRGKEKFQRQKVENSGALKYMDGLKTLETGSKQVEGIDFLVDDRKKEIERVNIPGFVFNREKHGIEDVIEKLKSDFLK